MATKETGGGGGGGNPQPLRRDALLPYISDDTKLGRLVKDRIQKEGFVVIPKVLTKAECETELSRLWDFVEATAPGVRRHDPDSWYPAPPGAVTTATDASADPWPHSDWAHFPDMCQSFQAGWLFSDLREKLAARVFAPLYGTSRLHSSTEGFTFRRPAAPGAAPNGAVRPRVAGRAQTRARGEHFDQRAAHAGLQCIQSSTALLDQDAGGADGCFRCWPGSHAAHQDLTRGTWRGRSDWVPLTDEELAALEGRWDLAPRDVPVRAGDVILWRSDLAHCGAGPTSPRAAFRAVSYTCMLPAAMASPDVLAGRLDEYLEMRTGDHRPNVRDRHFGPPRKEGARRGAPARGKYFAEGPPVLTWRQAQLYGLAPYDSSNGNFDISSKVQLIDAKGEEKGFQISKTKHEGQLLSEEQEESKQE